MSFLINLIPDVYVYLYWLTTLNPHNDACFILPHVDCRLNSLMRNFFMHILHFSILLFFSAHILRSCEKDKEEKWADVEGRWCNINEEKFLCVIHSSFLLVFSRSDFANWNFTFTSSAVNACVNLPSFMVVVPFSIKQLS